LIGNQEEEEITLFLLQDIGLAARTQQARKYAESGDAREEETAKRKRTERKPASR